MNEQITANSRLPLALFSFLGLTVSALVLLRETDALQSKKEAFFHLRPWNNLGLTLSLVVLLAVAVLVIAAAKKHAGSITVAIVAASITLACGLSYFYTYRGLISAYYPHIHDNYHYVLGPKYFEELGYFDLYACTLKADSQDRSLLDPTNDVRNLRSYNFESGSRALAATRCHHRFEAGRWQEFKRDVALMNDLRGPPHYLRPVLKDHGYNGTPFHAFAMGRLARLVPLTFATLNYGALIDVIGLCAMFAVVGWSFGWRWSFAMAAFFFLNFGDRQVWVGGSFCRYLWMVLLGMGIAFLNVRRYGRAGALLALSAMLNVFPALFLVGVGLKGALQLLRERSLSREYRRFALAAALVVLPAIGLGAAHGNGWANYRDYASFIGDHADKITTTRAGFRYLFLFRGGVHEDAPGTAWPEQVRELERLKPTIRLLSIVCVVALLLVATRLSDVEATIFAGIGLFFFVFGTVVYYYACIALLILMWQRRVRGPTSGLLFIYPFAFSAATWGVYIFSDHLKFVHNTFISVGIGSYLLATIVWFGFETRCWRDWRLRFCRLIGMQGVDGPRRSGVEALVVLCALLICPVAVFLGT